MPNVPRAPHRWDTKFGRFVDAYGVAKLADELNIGKWSIYHWLAGDWMPNPRTAMRLVKLSAGTAHPITLANVFEHAQDLLAAQARGETIPPPKGSKGNDADDDGS